MKDQGKSVPILDELPTIMSGADWLWEAFQILTERRLMTDQGPQPIPFSEISSYADYTQVHDVWERELLMRVVTRLDVTFIAHVRSKRKPGKRSPKP